MTDPVRRLSLRVGDFAIAAEGFDDPARPIRMLLRSVQQTLEETPEFANVSIGLDDQAVTDLLAKLQREAAAEDAEFEAIPGLVLIKREAVAQEAPLAVEEALPEAPEPDALPDAPEAPESDVIAPPDMPKTAEPEPQSEPAAETAPGGVPRIFGRHPIDLPAGADLADSAPAEAAAEAVESQAEAADLSPPPEEPPTPSLGAQHLAELTGSEDTVVLPGETGRAVEPTPADPLTSAAEGAPEAPASLSEEPMEIEEPAPAPVEEAPSLTQDAAASAPAPAEATPEEDTPAAPPPHLDMIPQDIFSAIQRQRPADLAPRDAAPAAEAPAEPAAEPEPINIFAPPKEFETAPAAASEPELEPAAATPDPTPAPAAEPAAPINIFAPPPGEEPVAAAPPPQPAPAEPPAAPVNIFAPPPEAPAPQSGTRQDALETSYRSNAMMGVPSEAPPHEVAPGGAQIEPGDVASASGAETVPELLTASAAYLTLVKDQNRFTRREVMTIFDALPGAHPRSLEARIKGYGKLVRNGQLVLVGDGLFALSQEERDRHSAALSQT
ncbi:MAG: hypothetical protein AAFR17_20405 [Pseudomonadota bacterium]